MLTAIRGGQYDEGTVRPFTEIKRESPQRPHVGIVAAGNWGAMWADKDYIPNVAMLTMAVSWACEALGCLCTSVLARNVMDYNDNKEHLGLFYVSRPGNAIPLKAYSAILHREMYRVGTSIVDFAHADHVRIKKSRNTERYLEGMGDLNEAADDEFNGVAWAKQQGASITIGIGDFDDSDEADVQLDGKITLEAAIDRIAERLEKQKRAA
jgi:hypothetical protein